PDLAYAVSLQDVLRQLSIAVRLRPIDHGEDDVETTEQRRRQVDLFRYVLVFVESAKLRIRGSEDRTSRLKDGRDARLCDADPLLFHSLMNRGSVLRTYLRA